jgi:hypothetical protein
MPTVLRLDGYRFFFYSNEGSEPPHVHVESAGKGAKFWLRPVALARSAGYDARELRVLRGLVEAHRDDLEQAWNAFHRP